MDLTIRKDGKLLRISSEKQIHGTGKEKTFFIDGETEKYVDQTYRIKKVTKSEHLENILLGEHIVAKATKGVVEYVKTDNTGYNDIFFSEKNGLIKVSSSLKSVVKWRNETKINEGALAFFRRNGYLERGKTFFTGIRRVGPKQKLVIKNDEVCFEYCSVGATKKPDYNTFKRVFIKSVDYLCDSGKKDIVLMSGGIDSASLLGVLKKKGRDVTAVTMRMHPSNEINGADIKRSKKVCESVGVPHNIVDISLDNIDENDFEGVIKNMSTAAHLSVHFKKIIEKVNNKNVQIWTGQNADTLYNLKQTDKGFKGIIKRAIQTDLFLEYIDDDNPSSRKKYVLYLLGKVLGYYFPKVESEKMDIKEGKKILDMSITEDFGRVGGGIKQTVYGEIYQNMLDEYYTGRDNKVWHAISENLNADINMPYSSAPMVSLFSQIGNEVGDVLYPKRYIYKIANEYGAFSYYAHSLFAGKYIRHSLDNSAHMSHKKWEQAVIQETNTGDIICVDAECKGEIPYSLQRCLSNYWLQKVLAKYRYE